MRPKNIIRRSGFHNLEHSHNPHAHVVRTLIRMQTHRLRVLGISEGRDYLDKFIELAPRYGFKVVSDVDPKHRGSDQCYAIVAEDAKVEKFWTFTAGTGWKRKGGGNMAPMQPLALVVDDILYIIGHAPVAAWVPVSKVKGLRGKGRVFRGAPARLIAYRGFVKKLRSIMNQYEHAVVWADWNCLPTTRGIYSPNWLRRKTGSVFVRPFRGTGHGEIDFAIVKGAGGSVRASVQNGNPSDHDMVYAAIPFSIR